MSALPRKKTKTVRPPMAPKHDRHAPVAPRNVVKGIAAQGDVTFVRVNKLPEGLMLKESGKRVVVAHSETGHHHIALAEKISLYGSDDPMVCYLVSEAEQIAIEHLRPFDTHASLCLDGPIWKVVRQREATPEGWKRVED